MISVSCTENPDTPTGTVLSVNGYATEGDVIEFVVTPDNADAPYVVGLLEEADVVAMGGEAGLAEYISAQVTSSSKTHKGANTFSYPGLQPLVKWYLYAAYVKDGSMAGTPTLSPAVRIYQPYSEYLSKQFCIPVAISDNGLWIVATYNGASFIFDRAYNDVTYDFGVESLILSDIDDNGIAYGEIDGAPIRIVEGEVEYISLPDGATGGGVHAVSPDGSKYYGWYLAPGTSLQDGGFKPYVCDNGQFSDLSLEGSHSFSYIDNNTNDTAYLKIVGGSVNLGQCAANGALAGYGLDNGFGWEQGVVWYPDGTFKVIGEGRMFIDFSWDYPGSEYIYGDMTTRISPNGKYAAGICFRSYEDVNIPEVKIPFIYNMETGEILQAEESECTNFMQLRVDGVSSKGYVFLSDAAYLNGDIPYVWTPETGIMALQSFLENQYGTIEPAMKGSVTGTTLDGDTYMLAYDVESPEAGTLTSIYTF